MCTLGTYTSILYEKLKIVLKIKTMLTFSSSLTFCCPRMDVIKLVETSMV